MDTSMQGGWGRALCAYKLQDGLGHPARLHLKQKEYGRLWKQPKYDNFKFGPKTHAKWQWQGGREAGRQIVPRLWPANLAYVVREPRLTHEMESTQGIAWTLSSTPHALTYMSYMNHHACACACTHIKYPRWFRHVFHSLQIWKPFDL